jgi:hypothetical protein
MRLAWFAWLIRHGSEFSYSNGPLRGTIGTIAVLLTAMVLGYALRRFRAVALTVAGIVCAGGIGWLATQ